MTNLSPQAQTVLQHLRSNPHLTPWQAEGVYRIRRLASRIDELRAEGYEIVTETKRDASGQRYTRYALSRSQKRVHAPLLHRRRQPSQFRIDTVAAAYRNYCLFNLDLDKDGAALEVAAFIDYLKEFAA